MENKINIAELLKDCPKGMELDCTLYDNIIFDSISDWVYPIKLITKDGSKSLNLTKYGCTSENKNAKCVIFPKGKTTWKGFHRPFKDGDVVAGKNYACSYITIFRKFINNDSFSHHVCLTSFGKFNVDDISDNANLRFATKEEKQKLFDAIKDNGYHWNAKTKTLEKLPKFKVGDRIRHKTNNKDDIYEISKVYDDSYGLVGFTWMIYMKYQDQYELAPNKFDITTLKPFESKVLIRVGKDCFWKPAIFGFYDKINFYVLGGTAWSQCIPYKDNEHLLGTTEDCDEFYKNWG